MSERNRVVDVVRGLGILAVVLGHNWMVVHDSGELHRLIFSFHMPLFFFLSGSFLKAGGSVHDLVLSKADSLLKPFVVTLAVVGCCGVVASGDVSGAALLRRCFGIMKEMYGTGGTIPWPWVPLWFLPHLLLASMLALLLVRLWSGKHPAWLWIVCALMLFDGAEFLGAFWESPVSLPGFRLPPRIGLPWSADLILVTTPFVVAGHLLKDRVREFAVDGAILAVAVVLFVLLHYRFDETVDYNLRDYGDPFISTVQAAAGIYICFCVAWLVSKAEIPARLLAYLGRASLFILIFHGCVQHEVFLFLRATVHDAYAAGVLAFLLGSLAPLPLFELARRTRVVGALYLPLKNARLMAVPAPA